MQNSYWKVVRNPAQHYFCLPNTERERIAALRARLWSDQVCSGLFEMRVVLLNIGEMQECDKHRKSTQTPFPRRTIEVLDLIWPFYSTQIAWTCTIRSSTFVRLHLRSKIMFNLPPTDIPCRGRNRMRQWRDLPRHNVAFGMGPVDDIWIPMSSSIMVPSILSRSGPELSNRLEELIDLPLPRSTPFTDVGYGMNYSNDLSRHDHHRTLVTPFERAAAALSNTLDSAIKFCKDVEKQFENETHHIATWVTPTCIDSLWTMKLDWNGLPATENSRYQDIQPTSIMVTYNRVVETLCRAVEQLQMSAGPQTLMVKEVDRSQQSPERIRTTFKKLLVTFQGIEELMVSVRTRRERMKLLHAELLAAQNMLRDIRDFWAAQTAPPKTNERKQKLSREHSWDH